jgi:hypothetical protein
MISIATKGSRKWMPVLKTDATYFKLFNRALDNLELNRREEKGYTLSYLLQSGNKKAGIR